MNKKNRVYIAVSQPLMIPLLFFSLPPFFLIFVAFLAMTNVFIFEFFGFLVGFLFALMFLTIFFKSILLFKKDPKWHIVLKCYFEEKKADFLIKNLFNYLLKNKKIYIA